MSEKVKVTLDVSADSAKEAQERFDRLVEEKNSSLKKEGCGKLKNPVVCDYMIEATKGSSEINVTSSKGFDDCSDMLQRRLANNDPASYKVEYKISAIYEVVKKAADVVEKKRTEGRAPSFDRSERPMVKRFSEERF